MPAHDPTALYRMSMVRDVRYAEDLPVVEGHDYILRVGEAFPLMVLGECLYGYRIHPSSVTRADPSKRNRLVQEVLVRMCRRRGYDCGRLRGEGSTVDANRPWDLDNDLVSHFTMSVADQVMAGDRLGALRTGHASWMLNPTTAYYAKPLLYSLMPRSLMTRYRAIRARREQQAFTDRLTRPASVDTSA
jgi:hypothetical protein